MYISNEKFRKNRSDRCKMIIFVTSISSTAVIGPDPPDEHLYYLEKMLFPQMFILRTIILRKHSIKSFLL